MDKIPIETLGMIVPHDEEMFNKVWRAMGRCFWMSYTGQNPDFPRDRRTETHLTKLETRMITNG